MIICASKRWSTLCWEFFGPYTLYWERKIWMICFWTRKISRLSFHSFDLSTPKWAKKNVTTIFIWFIKSYSEKHFVKQYGANSQNLSKKESFFEYASWKICLLVLLLSAGANRPFLDSLACCVPMTDFLIWSNFEVHPVGIVPDCSRWCIVPQGAPLIHGMFHCVFPEALYGRICLEFILAMAPFSCSLKNIVECAGKIVLRDVLY